MRLALATLSGLLLLAPLGSTAMAQDANAADVRCVIIAMASTNSPDQKIKTSGVMATFFFLGRLDGRTPNTDLEARMRQEVRNLTPANAQSEAQRCNALITGRSQALQAVAAKMRPVTRPGSGAGPAAGPVARPPAAKPPAARPPGN